MPDKLLTRRCCTCFPQRAPPTTGKHQECRRNDQKGSTGRRHNKGEFHPSRDGLHHSPILNSTIEQIGSDALIFFLCWMVNVNQSDIFQNKRGWRRFDFLRCWTNNGNQSTNFFKIKAGAFIFQISCW
ncbi:uncharacterized protein LOC144194788 isoform X2 [Stigmatopora nigra]